MRSVLSLWLCLSLSGCSSLFGDQGLFPSRSSDYLRAEVAAPIALPGGERKSALGSDYPIPDLALSQVLEETFSVPRVDARVDVDSKGSVRIQRLDRQQWLLVNAPAGQVWPLINRFLRDNGIALQRDAVDRGLLETVWLTADETPQRREQYRLTLVAGVQPNTTEIRVLQRAMAAGEEVDETSSAWPIQSSVALREDNMLNLLAEYLAESPQQSSYSLLAQGIGSASKVALAYDDQGRPYLDLQLPFDRAWASLGLALKKSSYRIEDLDRSRGLHYVHYQLEDKVAARQSFWRRWFSADSGSDTVAEDLLLLHSKHNGRSLIITLQRQSSPWLKNNEQAFLLKRLQHKLS